MTLGQDFFRHALERPGSDRRQISRLVHYQAQRQGMNLAEAFGIGGPLTIVANACASGANAVGYAWQLVRRGAAVRVLAGGYDALSQLVFAGFDSLQALSPTVCRPFDAERDGLALGEGAAVLALESLESAERRKAVILGEVVGYGATTDLHHLTQPHPEGEAAFRAMVAATRGAGVEPEQVGYINAHGTGTPLNDRAEAQAIQRWAGEIAARVAVSSTKAGIGHLLGAAGVVEMVVCLMALAGQWLPPTATLRQPDPVCRFRLVRAPEACGLEYALTNSFGFGGANASLLLRRWS
jgi:3-oxoacyl-[acyl-carrier-protein] synthase II